MARIDRREEDERARLREFNRQIEELQETGFFYDVFAVSPASIAVSRLEDQCMVAVNEGFSALFGYDARETIGRTAEDLGLDVDPEHRIHIFDRLRDGEVIRREETSIRTKEGEVKRVLGSFFVIEARGTKYAVSKLVDVTKIYNLREKVVEVSQRERKRIGQNLHDGVSSQLTGIDMLLGSMINELEADSETAQIEQLRRVRDLVRESAEDTRRLSHGLNPIRLSKGDLVDALQELANNTNDVSGVSAAYAGIESAPDLSNDMAKQLYWITQEAVGNARQHAEANHITVRLDADSEGHLILTVEDDGKGFSTTEVAEGMGLETIRYRSDLIGARFDIETAPGEGTVLRWVLPLNRRE